MTDFAEGCQKGQTPRDSGVPSAAQLRALEVGCGTGTNAIEQAR